MPQCKHTLELNWAVVRRMIMKNSITSPITSPKHMWIDLCLKQMHSSIAFQNGFTGLFFYMITEHTENPHCAF